MENFIEFSLLAYVGMLLHILKKLREAMKKPGFTGGGFLKDQLITIIMSLIATPLAIYLLIDNPVLQELYPLKSLTAVGVGYIGQSWLLSMLEGKFKPKTNENKSPTANPNIDGVS